MSSDRAVKATIYGFKSLLYACLKDDCIWVLTSALEYRSELVGSVVIPAGFHTDLASVPRLPFVYEIWGNRAHREAVLHDYLYRVDAVPAVSFFNANRVFLEAMESRGVSWGIRYPMFYAVCLAGFSAYHKRSVDYKY